MAWSAVLVSTTAVKSAVVSAVQRRSIKRGIFPSKHHKQILLWIDKPVVEFNDSATLVQVTMQPELLLQIVLSTVTREISQKWELAAASLTASPTRRRETCETILVDVQVVRFLKETIFINFLAHVRRKIWFTSGFHCADMARKLVFPSKLLFYIPDHQEFPTFCTRFLRGCWCHVGSTDESRRTFHRTRVLMKELLQWSTCPVWHLEGTALGTGNLDVSSDHCGGGWRWLVLCNGIHMTSYDYNIDIMI